MFLGSVRWELGLRLGQAEQMVGLVMGQTLSGFKYLHATSSSDAVADADRDILFRKHEWIVTRENMPDVCGKIFTGLPQYLVENGTYTQIEQQLLRWMHPDVYQYLGS